MAPYTTQLLTRILLMSTTFELDPSSKHLQSLKFSAATRRLPLLFFWIFLGVAVLVAGALAHERSTWQSFWNKEAVLDRPWTIDHILLGRFFDSVATRFNRIFVKGGWIVAGVLIILTQAFYVSLVMVKRDRVPSLQFIRHLSIPSMISIEATVLFAGTVYFLICTWAFNRIAKNTGSCASPDGSFSFPSTRTSCLSPATFRGFDISGHCFLIVHSCLLVLEYAAKVLFVWYRKERSITTTSNFNFNDKDSDLESISIRESLSIADISDSEELKSNDLFNRNYSKYRTFLIVLLVLVALLCGLEFLIFLQTILFYHTVLEKLLGTFIGSFFWFGLFLLSLKYPHLF